MNCWSHRPRSSRTSHSIDKPLFIRWWPGLFVFTIWSATNLKKKNIWGRAHIWTPPISIPWLRPWLNRHGMERTGLWDSKGSEGYIWVKLTLDSDVPWCLPALECVLWRQYFFVFGCRPCADSERRLLHRLTKACALNCLRNGALCSCILLFSFGTNPNIP